jgi:hypothetical protein
MLDGDEFQESAEDKMDRELKGFIYIPKEYSRRTLSAT